MNINCITVSEPQGFFIQSQVQADLQQQRQRVIEVDRFLDACMVMKRKVGEDMETIAKHCEKYGYRAPQNHQKTLSK